MAEQRVRVNTLDGMLRALNRTNASPLNLHVDLDKTSCEEGFADEAVGWYECACLAASIAGSTSLTSLTLDASFHECPGRLLTIVAEALKHNSVLRSLDICGDVDCEAVGTLTEALQRNQTLTSLAVGTWRPDKDDERVVALVGALGNNQSLRSLAIRCCKPRDQSWRALTRAIKSNDNLESVTVRAVGGNLCDEAGEALAAAVTSSMSLTTLDISCGSISHKAGVALADAIRQNAKMVTFSIKVASEFRRDTRSAMTEVLDKLDTCIVQECPADTVEEKGQMRLLASICNGNVQYEETEMALERLSSSMGSPGRPSRHLTTDEADSDEVAADNRPARSSQQRRFFGFYRNSATEADVAGPAAAATAAAAAAAAAKAAQPQRQPATSSASADAGAAETVGPKSYTGACARGRKSRGPAGAARGQQLLDSADDAG
eukprot:TRINITY_DN14928_c0_g1_i3.p1 TRINITY_DN14928_c0_g1~~TRINITY_DN14928_c0_g1_i3.p1  ORF type:complete len:495 (-),score=94.87 TRINITY_DN14928_c0_g1_i3:122-1423(-)